MPPESLQVKICGIKTLEVLNAAVDGGADYLGLVFYPASPRAITPALAIDLCRHAPPQSKLTGVFVDAENDLIEQVMQQCPLDLIQLQGMESPERVAEISVMYQCPVIKSLSIGHRRDLMQITRYRDIADMILLDARPPENVVSTQPSGKGLAFDWTILSQIELPVPWILSGGINIHNLGEAVETTRAKIIDVSSGVETAPGHKDPALIRALLQEARRY